MPTDEAFLDPFQCPLPTDFSGQVLSPAGPTIFRRILEYPPPYVPTVAPLITSKDTMSTGTGDIGGGNMDGDRPTSPAGAFGGPPLGPFRRIATRTAEVSTSTYDDVSPPGSPVQSPMDTLPPVEVQQPSSPPPPPAVEKKSMSVGTHVDLEVLYTGDCTRYTARLTTLGAYHQGYSASPTRSPDSTCTRCPSRNATLPGDHDEGIPGALNYSSYGSGCLEGSGATMCQIHATGQVHPRLK